MHVDKSQPRWISDAYSHASDRISSLTQLQSHRCFKLGSSLVTFGQMLNQLLNSSGVLQHTRHILGGEELGQRNGLRLLSSDNQSVK